MESMMRAILIGLLVIGVCGCGDATSVEKPVPVAEPVGDPIENSIGMVLVPIPAGEFMMGDQPLHRVALTKSFYLGRTEVTQGQWKAVMGTTPWKGYSFVKEGGDYPAVYVSWEDAVEFCRKLSAKEGVEYRLPTEAEWEYACRAGTTTVYSFGDDESQLGEYAWIEENTQYAGEGYDHIVGQKKPNPWGLYDMHGNVFEWCQDWYGEYPSDDVTDPVGPDSGSYRVSRGGGWFSSAVYCRSAVRLWITPSGRDFSLGFRVLRSSAK
jgi:formylglycine-generating enzyme required for sulfatase activity